jgi:hypothetical protein
MAYPKRKNNPVWLRRKKAYHRQDGKCIWCGEEMLFIEHIPPRIMKNAPDNLCTLEHLDDRYNPNRGTYPVGEIRVGASCKKCNHDYNCAREKEVGIEEIRRRSGH